MLEQALRHVRLQLPGSAAQAKVLVETAEMIRRLLHQFAAGFLKQPDQTLLTTLKEILDTGSSVADGSEPFDSLAAERLLGFVDEATGLLAQLGAVLRQWTARPDNLGARSEVLRLLRSFNASAQLAGVMRLSELAQRMAYAIEQLGVESLNSPGLAFLAPEFEALQASFERWRSAPGRA